MVAGDSCVKRSNVYRKNNIKEIDNGRTLGHQGSSPLPHRRHRTHRQVRYLRALFFHVLCSFTSDGFVFCREIIENCIAPKPQKMSAAEHAQITELLLAKDAELKKTLELAEEQAKIDEKMNRLKMEVDNQVYWPVFKHCNVF